MPNKPLQPSAKSAGLAAGARPRLMSRFKERPGFLSRCVPSLLFRVPPSDNAGVQSNRVVVRLKRGKEARAVADLGEKPLVGQIPARKAVLYIMYIMYKRRKGDPNSLYGWSARGTWLTTSVRAT